MQGAFVSAGAQWNVLDPKLVQYLQDHKGQTRYLVATTTSSYASIFMLDTNAPAMTLGGYQGWDRIVTPTQLAQMVANNTVRFFYISANQLQDSIPRGQDKLANTNNDLLQWIQTSCTIVPQVLLQTSSSGGQGGGGMQLYDCAAKNRTSAQAGL